ncbi:MAG TPA: DUF3574 domain-containing protein, partial [Thauera aminoaromatica]|nr:DUF3574 domain-containing protein [Thauera aminoaromatica]
HTLYFGRHSVQGPVTEADWQAFVDAEVTPRFMDGLTAWAARRQWRDIHTARIVREDSVVLQLVVPAHKDARGALRDIVAAYKARFDDLRGDVLAAQGKVAEARAAYQAAIDALAAVGDDAVTLREVVRVKLESLGA